MSTMGSCTAMLSGLVSGSEQIVLWKLTGARAKANDPISRRAMVVSQKEGVTKVKVMQKERTKGKMEKESHLPNHPKVDYVSFKGKSM